MAHVINSGNEWVATVERATEVNVSEREEATQNSVVSNLGRH